MILMDFSHLTDEQLQHEITECEALVKQANLNKNYVLQDELLDKLDNLKAEQFIRETDF